MPGGSYYTHGGGSKKKKQSPVQVAQAVAQAAQAVAAAVGATAPVIASTTPTAAPTATSTTSTATPTKPPPSIAKEFIKDSKKPKTVSGKYAKESEKAKAKRAKGKAKVDKLAKTLQIPYPKKGPSKAYEGTAAVNQVLRMTGTKAKAKESFAGKPYSRQNASTPFSGPKPRKVATRLQKAVKQAKPTFEGLDPEQSKVLRTVLSQGVKAGADRKTLLSAVETGLVESGLRNLDYGDADSQGWRQERAMYYPNPTNVKASAKRYFQEAAEAKAPGMTAGNLAQAAQQSAFPERYDEMKSQAKPLLKDFLTTRKESVPKPLKRTARQTLGKKPTKAILKGGKVIKDPSAGKKEKPSKADKRWGGAVGAIHAVLPKEFWPEAKGDKRTPAENAAVGGAADSDHLTTNTNSFGADLPADDNLAKQIAKNLGLPSHTGTQSVEKDGVRYQLIWQDSGHYDHIHLGAEVIDAKAAPFAGDPNVPIKGTKLAVKTPTPTGSAATGATTTFSGGTTSTGAPMTPAQAQQIKAELKRRKKSPSVSKRLRAIDAWLTTPITASSPDISQELIDRILGK